MADSESQHKRQSNARIGLAVSQIQVLQSQSA